MVGLGNPGEEYADTRHNMGWMLTAALREAWQATRPRVDAASLCSIAERSGKKLIIATPLTYMNVSGIAVERLMSHYGIELSEVLIITDDVNLPLGQLRIRSRGSDGGHKGLRSIIAELQNEEFARLRMGVGPLPPSKVMTEWVLEPFVDAEWDEVAQMLRRGIDAVETYLDRGIEESQERTNIRRCQSQ